VPAGISSITIEGCGAGAPGNPAINAGSTVTNSSGQQLWEGGGGGGSGQLGFFTIQVIEGDVLTILPGGVTAPGTDGQPTEVEIGGFIVFTCNGANAGTGMTGGAGASLNPNVFNSYSCGGSGGMNVDGGGSSGGGGARSTSFYSRTGAAAWEEGNSGNSGLNKLGAGLPSSGSGSGGAGGGVHGGSSSSPNGQLGCGGAGGSGAGAGPFNGGNGGASYVKLRLY